MDITSNQLTDGTTNITSSVQETAVSQVTKAPLDQIDKANNPSDKIFTLVNDPEKWGSHPVDQTTPWEDISEDESVQSTRAVVLSSTRRIQESNVWNSETPTGTSFWQMHYNEGTKRSDWQCQNTPVGIAGISPQSVTSSTHQASLHHSIPLAPFSQIGEPSLWRPISSKLNYSP